MCALCDMCLKDTLVSHNLMQSIKFGVGVIFSFLGGFSALPSSICLLYCCAAINKSWQPFEKEI